MRDRMDNQREQIGVEFALEHSAGTFTVKGLLRNNGEETVRFTELKALYRNFDGYIIEVDSLTCDGELPSGGTRTFAFPERVIPVGFYAGEVVVSKASTKGRVDLV